MGGPALLPPVGTSTLCDSPHPLGGSPQLEGGLPGRLTHAWKGRRAKEKPSSPVLSLSLYKPESAEAVTFRRTEHGIQAGAQFSVDIRSGSKAPPSRSLYSSRGCRGERFPPAGGRLRGPCAISKASNRHLQPQRQTHSLYPHLLPPK